MLEPEYAGTYLAPMFAYLIRRVGVAVLALAVLLATAPIVAAPASAMPAPCDCPSMRAMPMQDMHSHNAPMNEHGTPCKQACICGVSCGAPANLPQTFAAPFQNQAAQRMTFSQILSRRGISIPPAIPPPIASV